MGTKTINGLYGEQNLCYLFENVLLDKEHPGPWMKLRGIDLKDLQRQFWSTFANRHIKDSVSRIVRRVLAKLPNFLKATLEGKI